MFISFSTSTNISSLLAPTKLPPPLASAHVRPPVFPDCAVSTYPSVGALLTFKLASSTTLSAIVKAVLPVTSPVWVALVTLAVFAAIAVLIELANLASVTASSKILAVVIASSAISLTVNLSDCKRVFISDAVWSAVAEASIPFSFVWSASVNTLLSVALSTKVLISAAVWSAVAAVSYTHLTLPTSRAV